MLLIQLIKSSLFDLRLQQYRATIPPIFRPAWNVWSHCWVAVMRSNKLLKDDYYERNRSVKNNNQHLICRIIRSEESYFEFYFRLQKLKWVPTIWTFWNTKGVSTHIIDSRLEYLSFTHFVNSDVLIFDSTYSFHWQAASTAPIHNVQHECLYLLTIKI